MYVFLNFKFVDSLIEEQEKEFDSIARAQDWLKGQRETDFEYISLFYSETNDIADEVIVDGYSEIMEYKRETNNH